ncbi:hypothetical protein Tco_1091482 [Tanacetum coccineum]|uniref:Chromo domain-containing protein n=1 Tax=Tanacetum coccineum TaxID=301880 RepID=A0ABQ5I771_9ASTR
MLAPSGGCLIIYQAYGRKAYLLEDKQISSVGGFDEVFSTWMAFGGNIRDLGSFGEETKEITDLHQILEDALYGILPLSLIPYPRGSSKVASVDELERDELMRRLKQNLLEAKNIMEVKVNRNRREVEFKVGDKWSWLEKLHIDLHFLVQAEFTPFFMCQFSSSFQEKPVAICDSPMVLQNGSLAQQVLVQWDGRSPEEATWEWTTDFKDIYPLYNLEDKVISKARENVTPKDNGLGRGKRTKMTPVWQYEFVMG